MSNPESKSPTPHPRSAGRFRFILTIACTALLAFAWVFPQDFTNTSRPYIAAAWLAFAVRTWQFHIGIFLLILAAASLRIRRLCLFASLLALLTLAPDAWRARPKSPPALDPPTLTVMSINLLHTNTNVSAVVDHIRSASPDLLLFQEYTPAWNEALTASLSDAYPHRFTEPRPGAFGTAMFSRIPLHQTSTITLSQWDSPQQRAVVRLDGWPIAVWNIHLIPPHLFAHLVERRIEFGRLLLALDEEFLPHIVIGDMNFTDSSPQAAELHRRGLRDVHNFSGKFRGSTWPATGTLHSLGLGFRIDHIYLSRTLASSHSHVGPRIGSDHRPIHSTLGFPEQTR